MAAVDLLRPADVTGRCAGGGLAEEELEAGEAVGTGGETEADAGAGEYLVDDSQADALAVGLGGEERGEEVAGGFFRYGQAVVGYAPVARPGDNGNLIRGGISRCFDSVMLVFREIVPRICVGDVGRSIMLAVSDAVS